MVENNVELATSTKTETGFHERGYTHLGLVGMGYVTTLFYALCYKKKKKITACWKHSKCKKRVLKNIHISKAVNGVTYL